MSEYYTPEIEEFHVGFEFEVFNVKGGFGGMQPEVFEEDDDAQSVMEAPSIRVKHLNREDIESLGFVSYENRLGDVAPEGYRGFWNKEYHISTMEGSNRINISIKHQQHTEDLFSGIIKNKSEFKRILKQIGI